MTMDVLLQELGFGALGAVVGAAIAIFRSSKKAKALQKQLEEAIEGQQMALAASEVVEEQAVEAARLAEEVHDQFLIEERKKEQYLGKITEIIKERDVWRNLYHHEAAGHAGAQSLMMGTINQLVQKLQKATGKPVKLDPLIETVRSEYDAEHGKDAREAAEVAATNGNLEAHVKERQESAS